MVDTQTPPPTSRGGGTFLLDFFRTRPWAKRAVSVLSALLLIAGVALLAYPFATNLYQNRLQDKLSKQLASPSLKQKYRNRAIGVGDSLTRIKMPAIHVDVVVVEGITPTALRAGAGHYPQTPLPCEKGNVAIAGHRTTYGKPFANLDRLAVGDQIVLETPIGRHVYRVSRPPFVVANSDFTVISQTPGHTLTLTTCHPKGSASQRLVVKADMQ
jgi:sortase A